MAGGDQSFSALNLDQQRNLVGNMFMPFDGYSPSSVERSPPSLSCVGTHARCVLRYREILLLYSFRYRSDMCAPGPHVESQFRDALANSHATLDELDALTA
jgi:hypothetical protein